MSRRGDLCSAVFALCHRSCLISLSASRESRSTFVRQHHTSYFPPNNLKPETNEQAMTTANFRENPINFALMKESVVAKMLWWLKLSALNEQREHRSKTSKHSPVAPKWTSLPSVVLAVWSWCAKSPTAQLSSWLIFRFCFFLQTRCNLLQSILWWKCIQMTTQLNVR